MRESTVERLTNEFAKAQGIHTMKIAGYGDRGKPDRMFLKDGRILFMELKAPGKEPTALQYRYLSKLRTLGFEAGWADNAATSISQLKAFFQLP